MNKIEEGTDPWITIENITKGCTCEDVMVNLAYAVLTLRERLMIVEQYLLSIADEAEEDE